MTTAVLTNRLSSRATSIADAALPTASAGFSPRSGDLIVMGGRCLQEAVA